MAHAIFYMHQTSGVCVGMCMCDCTHQIEKTAKAVDFTILTHIFIKQRKTGNQNLLPK